MPLTILAVCEIFQSGWVALIIAVLKSELKLQLLFVKKLLNILVFSEKCNKLDFLKVNIDTPLE